MNARLALVVALALTAGCSALSDSGDTSTLTPAPVPQPATTTETSPLPPGVTGASIESVDRLSLAHLEATNGTAYVWQSNYTRIRYFGNKTFVGHIRQTATVENQSVYTYWTNRKKAPREAQFSYLGEYGLYADSTGRYTRLKQGGTFTYERLSPQPARQQIGRRTGSAVDEYLRTENVTVTETRVDGARFYEIVGTDYAFRSGYGIRDYTARAIVSPDGFVRSLAVSYNQTRDGEREHIEYTFAYSRLGNATVDEPDWVGTHWTDDGGRGILPGGENGTE